ncbi:S8 family serine peptidase [uncultured Xanthomonas sp.]|uniref:S8 family peptidase n=1 Tax=uncultured Xanthomonas sp. TaxID=152831 RepID=UPI0025EEE4AC|nr:S8 family serine peptidase [uncultured Xanthomonas sp.]
MFGTMFAKKRLSALVRLGMMAGLSLSGTVHAQALTNDPLSAQQWTLNAVRAPQAWALAPIGGEKIRVAVIDTGYTGHPDVNWAKDGAGQDMYLDSTMTDEDDPNSGQAPRYGQTYTHGTHVAGIVAARTGNGEGVAGVCPQCEVLPISVLLEDKYIAGGIQLAVRSGARVINLSFAKANVPCNSEGDYKLTYAAIVKAVEAGVSVVAAAGNHNVPGIKYDNDGVPESRVDVAKVTPASCPGVISVGASLGTAQQPNVEAPYSNGGASLTLTAPGGDATREDGLFGAGVGACPQLGNVGDSGISISKVGVLSAWSVGTGTQWVHCYRYLSGTSMAAPHVSGVIGLMLSVNPSLSPAQITNILQSSAGPVVCPSGGCGAGMLNAEAAVSQARSVAGQWTSAGPCRYNVPGQSAQTPCALGSMDVSPDGTETVTAYGHVWKFDAQGLPVTLPVPLSSSPVYARGNGPCTAQFAKRKKPCTFDTRAEVNYPGVGYLESITAYGRYWNFDANGQPFGPQGGALHDVPRYAAANGPCYQKTQRNPCVFDTRSLVVFPEWGGLVESVNAYGQYWMWDANGNLLASGPLQSVARYQQICRYGPAGEACKFDTRELKSNRHEVITAYGRYFEFNGETLIQNTALADMARFN